MDPFSIIVIGVLIFAVVFLFKNEIKKKIETTTSAKFGSRELFFKDETDKMELIEQRQIGSKIGATHNNISRVGNVFWLGHDLHYTVARLSTFGDKAQIRRGFRQVRHHLSMLEPKNKEFLVQVEKLESVFLNRGDVSEEVYSDAADELEKLMYRLGASIEAHQRDFIAFSENVPTSKNSEIKES